MKLRNILAGTALAALALATTGGAPLGIHFVQKAEAAVNVSFSVFYDGLADQGDWVRYDGDYVFIPADVDSGWRPYTRGHWVYAERYGWTWASDEPFGWATYHYGRWGYGEDIGWYWVPGKRWAPAWVSWRRSNDYIVWAPLPPRRGDDVDVSISISVGDIPEFYWVAVPTRRFLSPDLHVVIVHEDDPDYRQVIDRTEYVGAPRITNNIVVNNVIDVDIINQATGKKVKPVEVTETSDPTKAKATEQQVTVFQGEVTPDKAAKPKKVREATDVKKVKETKDKTGGAEAPQEAPAADANTGTSDTGTVTEDTTPPAKKEKAKKNAAEGTVETPPASAAEGNQPAAGEDSQPAEPATKKADKKPAKADKKAPVTAEDQQPADNADEAATPSKKAGKAEADVQPESKKAGKAQADVQSEDDQTGSAPAQKPVKEKATKKKDNKKKDSEEQPCDPNTADCQNAQ